MNKLLRYSFVALLAMIGINANAQEVTFDFTPADNPWGLPSTAVKTENSYSNGSYTITFGASSDGHKYSVGEKDADQNPTSLYLLFGKTNATLVFPAFSFDVEKIVIEGRSGASTAVKQNIYVGETAVSTETTGATGTNTYLINKAYQAAGNVYVLKINSKHNTQIKTISFYKASGISAPEISGDEVFSGSTQVTITADEGTTIYYTTDGNDPTASDAVYAGPFTLTQSATVKAVAAKDDVLSSVVSKVFTMTVGDGSEANPYTCADLLSLPAGYEATGKWVKGIIVGSIKNSGSLAEEAQVSNVALADAAGETDYAKVVPVALPAGDIRTAVNLVDNPTNLGKELQILGNITAYFGNKGVKYPTDFKLDGSSVNAIKANAQFEGKMYNVAGQVVNKGYKGLVIQDGRKFVNK